jgi:hypothetical protein
MTCSPCYGIPKMLVRSEPFIRNQPTKPLACHSITTWSSPYLPSSCSSSLLPLSSCTSLPYMGHQLRDRNEPASGPNQDVKTPRQRPVYPFSQCPSICLCQAGSPALHTLNLLPNMLALVSISSQILVMCWQYTCTHSQMPAAAGICKRYASICSALPSIR